MFEGEIDGCRRLTGGCGLAGIDVADNDHVDVHLFLTAEERRVSAQSIKIDAIVAIKLMMEEGQEGLDLTHPMLAVLDY